MVADILADALARSASRSLSVLELIRIAETVNQGAGPAAVKALYAGWIEHNADSPLLYSVLFNHSVVQADTGDLAGARASLERAIDLNPDFTPAHINLGRVQERSGDAASALQQWSAALERLAGINAASITHKTTTLVQAARVIEAAGQDDQAETLLRQCIEIDPAQREAVQHFLAIRQRQCEWPIVTPVERVDRATLMAGLSPLSAGAYADDPVLQLAVAWNYNRRDVDKPTSPMITGHWGAQRAGPLRIGYLSSDLREHAVGHLMAEVFQLPAGSAVETSPYYCGPASSDPLH